MLSISIRYGKNTLIYQGYSKCLPITATRQFAVKAKPKVSEEKYEAESSKNARSFNEIPGPSKFEFVRGVLPGGALYNKSFHDVVTSMSKKYGQFFRFPGLFGKSDMYISLNPNDYPIIFHNEGIWPHRRGFDTVDYFRQVHRREFFDGVEGIIASNGEQWSKWRSAVNPILMQPKSVIVYLNAMQEINDEFLARIRHIRDPLSHELPANFDEELNCLALETIAALALNTQLGIVHKNRESSEAKTIIKNVRRLFELSFELEMLPPFWKIIKTPKFHEIINVLDNLLNLISKHINEALVRIENDTSQQSGAQSTQEKSVLEKLSKVDKKLAVVMALDMFLAGIDTTISTMAGLLLSIAKSPEKQEKLFEEMKRVLPNKNSWFTKESMQNLPYLRACIKEGMRMYPILPGTVRKMPHDVVLSGYHIEKGAEIAAAASLLVTDKKFVPEADKFLPERWLRGAESDLSGSLDNPFLFIPFGFGPRSCAGKRIALMELELNLGRLVRNFQIEFNYPTENAFRSMFINVPNIPLKFKLVERPE